MNDAALRRVFNWAVTDLAFREELFGNLRAALLEQGVEEDVVRLIENENPQTIQALAGVLEKLKTR